MWLDEVTIGEKSNTKIGIMYVDGIVDKNKVKEIKEKISNIKIDSIVASNYVYEYLKENDSLFPSVLSTERPDLVSYKLLSGKIAVIVENSPFVSVSLIISNVIFINTASKIVGKGTPSFCIAKFTKSSGGIIS